MKKLFLKRFFADHRATLGVLQIPDLSFPLFTLENCWRQNMSDISCIPPAVYLCTPYKSKKYPDNYQLSDVPGRSKILIHVGNTAKDTKGCILLGMACGSLSNEPAILSSTEALNLFRSIINNQNFLLEIS